MDDINWLSMVLATLAPLVVGSVFYHPVVFGKALVDLPDVKADKRKTIFAFAIILVFSFFLSFFLLNFNNSGINQEGQFDTFRHGAWHGTFVAITIAAPVILINGFFGKRPWKHTLIHLLFWIITLALMGGMLDAMNHWENVILPEG